MVNWNILKDNEYQFLEVNGEGLVYIMHQYLV